MVEFYRCDSLLLNKTDFIETIMKDAAVLSGATIIDTHIHMFNPHGISGVVIIAESHLTIHTWPEYGYAAVDIFTCGENLDPWKALIYLKLKLKAKEVSHIELSRGRLPNQCKYKFSQQLLQKTA